MKTCLVVEDSETVRHIMTQLIEGTGCRTLQASTAQEGLDVTFAAEPDIVFLDWDLPGLAALDYLKGFNDMELTARPHVVLCAMENDGQQFALARAVGARFHIIKPYDKRDVADILGAIERAEQVTADDEERLAETA